MDDLPPDTDLAMGDEDPHSLGFNSVHEVVSSAAFELHANSSDPLVHPIPPIQIPEGRPLLSHQLPEVQEHLLHLLHFSLVVRVVGAFFDTKTVVNRFQNAWRAIKGRVDVLEMGNFWLLFTFSSQMDRDWVRNNRPYHVSNKLVVVLPFQPTFQPLLEPISRIDVWIRIALLPHYLITPGAIQNILDRNNLGTFIRFDEASNLRNRMKFTRLCINIFVPETGFFQGFVHFPHYSGAMLTLPVYYEGFSKGCACCSYMGHSYHECPLNTARASPLHLQVARPTQEERQAAATFDRLLGTPICFAPAPTTPAPNPPATSASKPAMDIHTQPIPSRLFPLFKPSSKHMYKGESSKSPHARVGESASGVGSSLGPDIAHTMPSASVMASLPDLLAQFFPSGPTLADDPNPAYTPITGSAFPAVCVAPPTDFATPDASFQSIHTNATMNRQLRGITIRDRSTESNQVDHSSSPSAETPQESSDPACSSNRKCKAPEDKGKGKLI